MNKPLWAAGGVLLLSAIGTGGGILMASSGGEEEVLQQVATPTTSPSTSPQLSAAPTSSPEPSPKSTPTTTAPTPTPVISLPPVPADWATFSSNRVPEITFRYPQTWFLSYESRITSFDPSTWKGGYFPPGGILLDFDRIPLEPSNGIFDRPPEATDVVFGGLPGWQALCTSPDPNCSGAPWAKRRHFAVERNGYRYVLYGAFADKDADESVLLQVASTFRFID